MFKDVQTELDHFKNQFFTGHVKFGMEHGTITSMTITSKVELNAISKITNDLDAEIVKMFPDENDFYGNLDFNFDFGKIISNSYSTNFQGEQLRERIRKHQGREVKQCKNVKPVENK